MANGDRTELEKLSELRGQAEELLRRHISNPQAPSPEEVQNLVHELEVHQIELEMQNRELREAQRLLEESRDRYADLYDFAPLGYVTLDKRGCIQEINLAAAKLLGKERKFLLGMPISTFVVQEQKAALRDHLEKCAQGLDKVTSELSIATGDGTSNVVEFHSIPIQDAESGHTLFRTAITDITARKRAEQEIESLARFPAENPNPIIRVTDDGIITYANPASEELLGRLGSRVGQSLPETWRQMVGETFREGTTQQRDVEVGDRVYSVYLHSVAGRDYVNLYPMDITERKKAEEELTFRNILLTTEQDVSPDAILIVDGNGSILSFNQQFVDMWGIPPEALASQSDELAFKSVLDKLEEPEHFLKRVKQLYAAQHATSRDEISFKDGRTFERYSAPMFGPDEKYYGRVWNFRDITDRVESRKALRDRQERLRAMALDLTLGEERERRRIATGLHDQVGQTLTLLCVRMERLAETAGTTNLGDQCREILAATRTALGMTRSLTFELSPPVLYEFGLVPAVKWLGHELQQQCGITFTAETTGDFESPEEDVAILLFQTIRELLTNVVKHSKARECHTTFSPGEHQLVITVQDDGVGFDAGIAHLHRTTHGSFGLFSIQERLKGLGGDMAIESKPDHGSRVKLWIPREHGSADEKEGAK